MRHEKRDADYLRDMLKYARDIMRAIEGCTLDDYLEDEILRLSIERRIEIIGEAARRISEEFQTVHPEIPWHGIIAQRNILTHEYGEIQDDIIWNVAKISVPELVKLLETLV